MNGGERAAIITNMEEILTGIQGIVFMTFMIYLWRVKVPKPLVRKLIHCAISKKREFVAREKSDVTNQFKCEYC